MAAIDAFRAASNDDKPARADVLDKVTCTDKEVCDVKAVCAKSANATAKGLRLQREVHESARSAVTAASASSAVSNDELADKWKEASSELAEGYGLLEECRAKTQALKERFGI